MKRSEKQDEEAKRPKIQDSPPDFNPFLVEPILVKLLKLMDKVTQLKELRLMCQVWDEYILTEVEERAFNGKLKAIDFSWTEDIFTKSEAEANLVQFLGDTQFIPGIFYSFKFNFPESWFIFSKHMEFLTRYHFIYVDLGIPNFIFEYEKTYHKLPPQFLGSLNKFMQSERVENLKGITFSTIDQQHMKFGFPVKSIFDPPGSMARELQKLDIKNSFPDNVFNILKSFFASGNYTNVTSMGIENLGNKDLDFPGLDLSKLTRLEIGKIGDRISPALKFTSSLIALAENGMTLKHFGMGLDLAPNGKFDRNESFFANLPIICSNLTQFLTSQSSTLETLIFTFVCHLKDLIVVPEGADICCKIHLPKFEVLHSLKLKVDYKLIEVYTRRTHAQIFEMTQNISVHFPKLVNLTLDGEGSLIALNINPIMDEVDSLQLERLEILDNYNPNAWNPSYFVGVISSVENLICPAKILGEILPWGESLRSLYIHIYTAYEGIELKTLKLNHFKKLKKLYAEYYRINKKRILVGHQRKRFINVLENYKNTFKEAIELDLTSITFIGPNDKKIILREELKGECMEYFPFPAEFKI